MSTHLPLFVWLSAFLVRVVCADPAQPSNPKPAEDLQLHEYVIPAEIGAKLFKDKTPPKPGGNAQRNGDQWIDCRPSSGLSLGELMIYHPTDHTLVLRLPRSKHMEVRKRLAAEGISLPPLREVPAADSVLWKDHKLTPEQPFPAKVRGIAQDWPGFHLFLEEIGGNRRCTARVWQTMPLEYSITEPGKDVAPDVGGARWTYLTPSADLNTFSWCMGIWKLGRVFGEEDVLWIITEKPPQKD